MSAATDATIPDKREEGREAVRRQFAGHVFGVTIDGRDGAEAHVRVTVDVIVDGVCEDGVVNAIAALASGDARYLAAELARPSSDGVTIVRIEPTGKAMDVEATARDAATRRARVAHDLRRVLAIEAEPSALGYAKALGVTRAVAQAALDALDAGTGE